MLHFLFMSVAILMIVIFLWKPFWLVVNIILFPIRLLLTTALTVFFAWWQYRVYQVYKSGVVTEKMKKQYERIFVFFCVWMGYRAVHIALRVLKIFLSMMKRRRALELGRR